MGADVDGVAVALAQEFEQVQLDLAIARVIGASRQLSTACGQNDRIVRRASL